MTLLPSWIDCYVPVQVGDRFALYLFEGRWQVALDAEPGLNRILVRVVKVRRQASGALAAKIEPTE